MQDEILRPHAWCLCFYLLLCIYITGNLSHDISAQLGEAWRARVRLSFLVVGAVVAELSGLGLYAGQWGCTDKSCRRVLPTRSVQHRALPLEVHG